MEKIFVTKPFLPELSDYIDYLKKIWENNHLTNNGPLVRELEERIREKLGAKYFFYVTNGTIALQLAIRSLDLKGEIITTPFSYVASTSAIIWENCTPRFVDIEDEFLNINPNKVEEAINENTSAILATHVFGHPCAIEILEAIAEKHNLKIIYDGAHAFNVKYSGRDLTQYGNVTTLSFHATKLFQTVEGGGIVTNDDETAHRINYMRTFGHNGPEKYFGLGINGKNSEFHAAMGLCILPLLQDITEKRAHICRIYSEQLGNENIQLFENPNNTKSNFSFFPVIFPDTPSLLRCQEVLNEEEIYPRRYFFPALNTLPYVENCHMPVAEDISSRIMCLPLYPQLKDQQVFKISGEIKKVLQKKIVESTW